ncbi:MAG TPA: hypothetical protein VF292_03705 [Rhodanobacteraceae bacterium]
MNPSFRTRALAAAVSLGLFGFSAAALAGPPIPPGATPAGTAFPPIPFTVQMGTFSHPVGTPFTTTCAPGYTGTQSGTYQLARGGSGWTTDQHVTSSNCQPPVLPALQPQCIVYTNEFGQYGYANGGCGYSFNTSAGLNGEYVWESQFRLLDSSGAVFNNPAWRVTWTGYCNGSGGTCVGPNRDFAARAGQTTYDSAQAYATVTSVYDPAVTHTYTIPAAIAAKDACTLSTPPWASLSPSTSITGSYVGISWGASHFDGCSGTITYYVAWHNNVTGSGWVGATTGTSMTNNPSPANSYQYYTVEATGDGLTSGVAITNTDHIVAPPPAPPPNKPIVSFASLIATCETAPNGGGANVTNAPTTPGATTVTCIGKYPTEFPSSDMHVNYAIDLNGQPSAGVTYAWKLDMSGVGACEVSTDGSGSTCDGQVGTGSDGDSATVTVSAPGAGSRTFTIKDDFTSSMPPRSGRP